MESDYTKVVGILAGVMSLVAYFIYIAAIFKGTTQPSRVTWWVLTVGGAVSAASYYAGGARETMWVPLAYVVGPFLIAILSVWRGEGRWTRFDSMVMAGALIAVLFWWLSEEALVALLVNIGIDFIGIIPTIKKSFFTPEHEDRRAWSLELGSGLVNLLAIGDWSFHIWVYPVYLVLINGVITSLLWRRK